MDLAGLHPGKVTDILLNCTGVRTNWLETSPRWQVLICSLTASRTVTCAMTVVPAAVQGNALQTCGDFQLQPPEKAAEVASGAVSEHRLVLLWTNGVVQSFSHEPASNGQVLVTLFCSLHCLVNTFLGCLLLMRGYWASVASKDGHVSLSSLKLFSATNISGRVCDPVMA